MRRRRVFLAALVLLAGVAVLYSVLRPSGAPGTTRVTPHGRTGSGNAFPHLRVPVDAAERQWRKGIAAPSGDAVANGPTYDMTKLRDKFVAAVRKTGATVVRIRLWPQQPGAVEVVLGTTKNPAQYLVHDAARLVRLLGNGYPYVKIVNSSGARIFEWYYLPGSGMVGYAKGLDACGPVYHSEPVVLNGTRPSCPAK